MFVLALRTAIAVVNTYVAIKNILTAARHDSPKTFPALEDTKPSIQIQQVRNAIAAITTVGALKAAVARQLQHATPRSQQLLLTQHEHNASSANGFIKSCRIAFYAQVEHIVCTGLLRQHTILHLNIPEDILQGSSMDVRMLDELKLFIPGFEQIQMDKLGWKIESQDPHQEPVYWPNFHLVVDYRFLYDNKLPIPGFAECQFQGEVFPSGPYEEPENLIRRRRPPPRYIQLPPDDFGTSVPAEASPVNLKIITDQVGLLQEKIAFYKAREENGQPESHNVIDIPDAPDYFSHHLFQAAFLWNDCHTAYRRDPEGTLKWFEEHPQKYEKSVAYRQGAEQYRELYPADFQKYFPGSLDFIDTTEVAVDPASESDQALPALSICSTAASPSSPTDSQTSNTSNYSSGFSWALNIATGGVTQDPAVLDAKISRRRWSDVPGANDFAHESYVFIVDYAHRKMAEIFQAQGHIGYDALEARFGVFGYDPRLYDPVPQSE